MPTFLLRLLFLPLILLLAPLSSSSDVCPDSCSCQAHGNVFCIHRRSPAVPRGLPAATRGLYVFQNGIGALARDDFAGLALLDMLDLSQNELADLPDGVFEPLSALRNLDLSSNAIVRVSRGSFSGLAGLERLYLHGNRIRSIEADAFEGLKGLLELKLQGNQLTSLPALRLPRLLLLDLSSNRLPTLGPAELQTPHLESLKVAALGLTSLDEELMASLGNLHDLDVSENELREVPRSLWAARGLIKLSLAANPLRDLGREEEEEEEGGLAKMAALQELDLSGLNINELPRRFLQLFPRLAVLTAAENPFNCLCALAWLPGWLRERGVALGRPEETRCHFPPVNAGRTLAELERHDFGCPPTTTLATSAPGGGGGGEEEGGRWSTPPSPTTASPEAWYTAAPPPPPSEEPPSTGAEFDVPRPPAPGGGGGEQEEDGEGHICPANICLNGGTCRFDGHGQLACVCPAATSGHYCENLDEEEEEVERKEEEEEEEVRRPFLPEEDAAAASVAPAAAVTAEHDDISSRQVTSTSILLDLHRFIETRPRIRGIKLTYRNLSGPDLRPVHLSVPASYPQYTLRGLRPNCTYSVCASPLGDRGGAVADGGGRGSCVEARTAGVQAPSSEPQVVGPDPLAYALVPALAALALVLGAALAAGAVVFVRRRRRRRAKDGASGQDELGGPAELSPLELEGVKACLENGGGGAAAGLENGGGGGSEAERSRAPVRPPSPQGGGLEYEVPLMRGQGHCSSNNNVDAMKPSYF